MLYAVCKQYLIDKPESVKLNRQKQNHFIIRKNRAKNIKNI